MNIEQQYAAQQQLIKTEKLRANAYFVRFRDCASNEQVARFMNAMETQSEGSQGIYKDLMFDADCELLARADWSVTA